MAHISTVSYIAMTLHHLIFLFKAIISELMKLIAVILKLIHRNHLHSFWNNNDKSRPDIMKHSITTLYYTNHHGILFN